MRNVLNCGQFLSSFMEVMQDQFVFYKCDVFYLVNAQYCKHKMW